MAPPSVAALRARRCTWPQPTPQARPTAALPRREVNPRLQRWARPRGAAHPASPAEQAIHHTILRAFAIHGEPPASIELDAVAAEFDTSREQIP